MLSINTNIPSLIAQRSLNNSTQLLNQSIERMTTGFKINHASDNAANYSISTNMSNKIGAYQVAEDNVAMGLDLLSTASGFLDLISDKLSRLRALAEQASNGTYGEQSLKAINTEANAIVDEIERIYSTAEYNGIKLFEEAPESTSLIKVEHRDTSSMKKLSDIQNPYTGLAAGTYSISTLDELVLLSEMQNNGYVGSDVEFVLANNINIGPYSFSGKWTPIGQGKQYFTATFDGNGYEIQNLTIDKPAESYQGLFAVVGGTIKNLGVSYASVKANYYSGILAAHVTSQATIINSYTVASGVGDFVGYDEGANIDKRSGVLTEEEYNNFRQGKPYKEEKVIRDLVFQIGIDSSRNSQIAISPVFSLDVSLLRGIGPGGSYLSQIDELLNTVSAKQTDYGAVENRLESALEEISTQYDNLVSSRSTLRDADIAEVSSEYIRQQILQQASATLLATANQSPSLALQLL